MLYQPDYLLWEDALRSDLALEVDEAGFIQGAPPKSQVQGALRLKNKVLLPGLVNAHSHAFQRLIRGRTEYVPRGASTDDFWSWRASMYQVAQALSPEDLFIASRQAFLEMAYAGITAVGEFHYLHHGPGGIPYDDPDLLARQVIAAARGVGLRICLLRVAYARAGFNRPTDLGQARFRDSSPDAALRSVSAMESDIADPLVTVGLAPHSVRAVPKAWLEVFAQEKRRPLHMHVAEQPKEVEACVAEYGKRPVQLLEHLGMLRQNFTAVHAIHLESDEVQALGRSRANVCACPSTERNLGDGIVPADGLLKAGVGLSLGSDSQARIDLLEEARGLEGHLRLSRWRRAVLDPGGGHPSGLSLRLLQFASMGGARALGLLTGVLTPKAPADFFTLDLGHPSLLGADERTLLAAVVFGAERVAIRDVAVQGRFIVQNGVHALDEESARSFRALSERIFS